MKALIIEDEPRARTLMCRLLQENFPQIEVAGAVGSVHETLDWLASHEAPDVIFMDVELSDGTGFDLFNQTEIPAPVIMTTAYDQYAVHAFEINAIDYLLKPIELPALRRAIARVEAGEAAKPSAEAMRSLLDSARKEKFLIRMNNRIVPVRTADIAYFYSEAKNSFVVTVGGTIYVVDDSLDAIAEQLDPQAFFRISRSCIIAEPIIDSVSRLMGGRLHITIKPGIPAETDFTVSRARVENFLAWLER